MYSFIATTIGSFFTAVDGSEYPIESNTKGDSNNNIESSKEGDKTLLSGRVNVPIDLHSLKPLEARDFLNSFDTIISDCDGVLWIEDRLPGVKETIQKIKEIGKKIHFVSNNAVKTPEAYEKQFQSIGISLKEDGLLHPGMAIIRYLKSINFDKKVYCITTTIMMNELTKAGFRCVTNEGSSKEDLKWFMEQTKDDDEIGAIVIDFDVNVNYLKLCKALAILRRPDVLYIVGATEKTIKVTPKLTVIGPGLFVNIINELSGRQPIKLSKPSEGLKQIVMKSYNITDPKRTLIIGDTFDHDMEFGHLCGFQKLIVLSGATSLEHIKNNHIAERSPDWYINSFGNFLSIIEKSELE